jgi:hypothetical protein
MPIPLVDEQPLIIVFRLKVLVLHQTTTLKYGYVTGPLIRIPVRNESPLLHRKLGAQSEVHLFLRCLRALMFQLLGNGRFNALLPGD